jgi:hypothetical protein
MYDLLISNNNTTNAGSNGSSCGNEIDYDAIININTNTGKTKIKLDDFCFDIHTKTGSKLGKSSVDFALD